MNNPKKKTIGRRPGNTETREAILASANESFSKVGFAHTTIRGVAASAGVDPALVLHYFKSKHELFLAAILPTYRGPSLLSETLAGLKREDFGVRISELFCFVMEDSQTNMVFLGMVRAAASEPKAAQMLQQFIEQNIMLPLTTYLEVEDADIKAGIIGSHIVGVFFAKYVTCVEPLASASPSEIAAIMAPALQTYLDA